MLSYEDGIAAMEWLAKAFGFRECTRMLGSDGSAEPWRNGGRQWSYYARQPYPGLRKPKASSSSPARQCAAMVDRAMDH